MAHNEDVQKVIDVAAGKDKTKHEPNTWPLPEHFTDTGSVDVAAYEAALKKALAVQAEPVTTYDAATDPVVAIDRARALVDRRRDLIQALRGHFASPELGELFDAIGADAGRADVALRELTAVLAEAWADQVDMENHPG